MVVTHYTLKFLPVFVYEHYNSSRVRSAKLLQLQPNSNHSSNPFDLGACLKKLGATLLELMHGSVVYNIRYKLRIPLNCF